MFQRMRCFSLVIRQSKYAFLMLSLLIYIDVGSVIIVNEIVKTQLAERKNISRGELSLGDKFVAGGCGGIAIG